MRAASSLKIFKVLSQNLFTLKHVGLGYMKIGQQATTLSGGEAQRIKLAKELSKRPTGRHFIFSTNQLPDYTLTI